VEQNPAYRPAFLKKRIPLIKGVDGAKAPDGVFVLKNRLMMQERGFFKP